MDDPSLSSTKVDKDTDIILDTHDSDRGTGQWKLSGDHGICNPVVTIADEQELDNGRGDDVSSTQYDNESGSTPHAKDISSGNTANNDSTNIWAKQSMDADKGPDTSVQKLSISIVSDTIVEADTMDKYASQTLEDAVRQRTSTAPDGQVSSNAAVSVIDTSHTSDSFSGDTDNATADMDIKCDLNVEHSSETVDVSDNFRAMRHNREDEEDDEYSKSDNKKLKKDNESDHSSSETIKNMHTSITGLGDPMPDRQDGVKEDNLSSCSAGSHPPIDDTPSKDPTLKSDTDYDSPTDNPPPPPPLPSCPSPPPPFSSLPPSELPSLPPPPIFYISSDTEEKPPLDPADPCVIEMNILQKTEAPNVAPPLTERCDSQLSTMSEKMDICRICHCEGEENNKLISPCLCSGSLKYIHLACLQKWIKSSDKKSCELCNFDYIMTMKTRPFKQWERLEMTSAERRKIVCSVTFHIIAITCVIWSLYVLIDRTTEEVHSGTLDWPFWTKLIVVAIGFTGGLVFMYVQCKMYVQLCLRWRQFNKLINIENAPEDADLRAEAAARIKARSGEQGGVVNTIALQDVDSL